jgi:hypothetical protein
VFLYLTDVGLVVATFDVSGLSKESLQIIREAGTIQKLKQWNINNFMVAEDKLLDLVHSLYTRFPFGSDFTLNIAEAV